MKLQFITVILTAALFSSCAMNDETLLPPESEVGSVDRTETDLAVWIDSSIQNDFDVSSVGRPTARFQKYRTTLENAFRETFRQYFGGVYFTSSIPSKGVSIRLLQASPEPRASGKKLGLEISWSGEIYRNGIRVHRSEGKSLSDEFTGPSSQGAEVMKAAFRAMTEQFGKEVRAIADGADPSAPVAKATSIPVKKSAAASGMKPAGATGL